MNNRFKFRIYCKSEKKMMLFNNPTIIDGDILRGGLLFKNYDHKITNCHEVNPEDLILMQCTGLKDKNGNLIYEGDIVKINTHYNHLVHDDYEYDYESEKGYSLFKIIYNNDMARFGAERIKCVKWETYHYSLDYVPHNHKVIGNIYENKELLESEG